MGIAIWMWGLRHFSFNSLAAPQPRRAARGDAAVPLLPRLYGAIVRGRLEARIILYLPAETQVDREGDDRARGALLRAHPRLHAAHPVRRRVLVDDRRAAAAEGEADRQREGLQQVIFFVFAYCVFRGLPNETTTRMMMMRLKLLRKPTGIAATNLCGKCSLSHVAAHVRISIASRQQTGHSISQR